MEISDENIKIMHDLITQINLHYNLMSADIRDLNNLIHVIKGDGIRTQEFIRRYAP